MPTKRNSQSRNARSKAKRAKRSSVSLGDVFMSGFVPCMFVLSAIMLNPQARILIAGEYPPAGSTPESQHDNRTSTCLCSAFGHDNFDWIDLLPYAPLESNKTLNRTKMKQYVRNNVELALNWWNRIKKHVKRNQIVWVAGDIAQMAWLLLAEGNYLGGLEAVADFGKLTKHTLSNGLCFFSLQRRHPCQQFYSKNWEYFCLTIRSLNVLRVADGRIDAATLDAEMTASEQRGVANQSLVAKLFRIAAHAWPVPLHKSIRALAWDSDSIVSQFRRLLKSFGKEDAVKLMKCACFVPRVVSAIFLDACDRVVGDFGKEAAVWMLSTDSFSAALLKHGFYAAVKTLVVDFSKEAAVDFGKEAAVRMLSTDSFSAALLKHGFYAAVKTLVVDFSKEAAVDFGKEAAVRMLSTDSFCAALLKHGFYAAVKTVAGYFGKEAAVSMLSTGCFSAALAKPKFLPFVATLSRTYDHSTATKLLRNSSFSSNALNDGFEDALSRITKHADLNELPRCELFQMLGFSNGSGGHFWKVLPAFADKFCTKKGKAVVSSLVFSLTKRTTDAKGRAAVVEQFFTYW